MEQATRVLDATGLLCPMPVLRAQKALRQMAQGQVLELHTTDPASWSDVETYCQEAGNILLDRWHEKDNMTFLIERG